jgi:hypothetical protein
MKTMVIADLGKVLLHPGFGAEPQWAVVGEFNHTFDTTNKTHM